MHHRKTGSFTTTSQRGKQVRSIKGPKVRLHPKVAEALALTIHELATNAVKYGALSTERGRIEVTWSIEKLDGQDRLCSNWTETGVKPKRRGVRGSGPS